MPMTAAKAEPRGLVATVATFWVRRLSRWLRVLLMVAVVIGGAWLVVVALNRFAFGSIFVAEAAETFRAVPSALGVLLRAAYVVVAYAGTTLICGALLAGTMWLAWRARRAILPLR